MINDYYNKNIEHIQQAFSTDGHVVLFDFFDEESYNVIKDTATKTKLQHEKNPLTHSYAKAETSILPDNLFKFVSIIINKKINSPKQTLLQFKHKDYIILNDTTTQPPGVDIILDITENWNEAWGGSIIYTNNSEDYTKIPIQQNTVTIVKRNNTQRFVKYINNKAQNHKRIFVIISV